MMKRILVAIALLGFILTISAQENRVTVSGGYAFTNIEDFSDNATGWRLNATYEFNPAEGKVSHGIVFGYIHTEVTSTGTITDKEHKQNSYPIYYAPKFELGNEVIKGFVKGAIGTHFSNYKREGDVNNISGNDMGFYGGASLGGMVMVSDALFINVEYEWAYLSNSMYKDGFMNSIMAGIGIKF